VNTVCSPRILRPPRIKRIILSPGKHGGQTALDLAQLQDFVEDSAPTLTKMLAGATPEFVVKIRLKGKKPASLAAANEVLKKIHPDWKFGGLFGTIRRFAAIDDYSLVVPQT
jgi:hypothetical protein